MFLGKPAISSWREAASSPILVPFLNGRDALPCHAQPFGCKSARSTQCSPIDSNIDQYSTMYAIIDIIVLLDIVGYY